MAISVAGNVGWMTFGRSGTRLAVKDDTGVTVYEYPHGTPIFKRPRTEVWDCALSPDGRLFAGLSYKQSGGYLGKYEQQYVQIWDTATSQQVCHVQLPFDRDYDSLCCMKYSPDNTLLAFVRDDGLVSIIRVATGETFHLQSPRKRYSANLPSCLFFPGSDLLVYTHLNEAINIAAISTRRTVFSLKLNSPADAFSCNHIIGIRPSDQKLLVSFHGKDDYHNAIDTLDPRNGARTPFVRGFRGQLWSPSNISLSPGGDHLAASVLKGSFLLARPSYVVAVWDELSSNLVYASRSSGNPAELLNALFRVCCPYLDSVSEAHASNDFGELLESAQAGPALLRA